MNITLFEEYIEESSYSKRQLAKECDISTSTFYYNIKNNKFYSSDLKKIFDTLNLTDTQILALFK